MAASPACIIILVSLFIRRYACVSDDTEGGKKEEKERKEEPYRRHQLFSHISVCIRPRIPMAHHLPRTRLFDLRNHQRLDRRRHNHRAGYTQRPGRVHSSESSVATARAKDVWLSDMCWKLLEAAKEVVADASMYCQFPNTC